MHLLQLCPRVPWPLTDGGRIGIYHLTRSLARHGHTIDMIAFAESDTTESDVVALSGICRLQLVHDNIATNFRNFLRSAVRNEPVYVTRHRSKRFLSAMRETLAHKRYDAVLGDHSAMFPYVIEARRIARIPAVIRLHNIESVIWHRYAHALRNPVKRWIAYRQATMLERFEARNAERVDANFTITDVDQLRIEHIAPHAHVRTVPPGVDTEYWSPVLHDPASTIAILATTYSWIHNVSGVLWFIDQALPRIRERIPEFELHLLGKCPPPVLRDHANSAVKVLGFVDDIRAHAANAGVYIVPLHVGGGIRIKILEAMAMGMAVVTTSIGCEGIPGKQGIHFLIADSAEEFAEAVVTVLTRPDIATAIGRAAREFVVEHFNWDRAADAISDEIQSLIARNAAAEVKP